MITALDPRHCPHPPAARSTRPDSPLSRWALCAACASGALVCTADDGCAQCEDGVLSWRPLLHAGDVPAAHWTAAGLERAGPQDRADYLRRRYLDWREAQGSRHGRA